MANFILAALILGATALMAPAHAGEPREFWLAAVVACWPQKETATSGPQCTVVTAIMPSEVACHYGNINIAQQINGQSIGDPASYVVIECFAFTLRQPGRGT